MKISSNIRIDKVIGSRRLSNYWWATSIFIGGLGFFIVGLSSYFNIEILPFTNSSELMFLPQGAVMTFYGTIALIISIFIWLTIIWNVGGGYNKFDNDEGTITIFRLGFPGENRSLELIYKINDIKAVKINIQEGLTPKREIYLKIKDEREIPLTRVGQPLMISEIEEEATALSRFLGVVLEGVD